MRQIGAVVLIWAIALIALFVWSRLDEASADGPMLAGAPQTSGGRDMFLSDRFEARAWIANNPNAIGAPFAGNRFMRQEALAFVDNLYALGAVRVDVTNIFSETWRIEQEGGPYADTLIVRLPDAATQRAAIFAVAAREASQEGLERPVDSGQDELTLWWD